jgi:gliding motility-associated-like protein
MSKNSYIIPLLVFLSLTISKAYATGELLEFIKNKNQFPAEAGYKANLPGGAVFLTKSGFRFNYYNQSDLHRIHDLKHENRDVTNEPVNFHAYELNFENANATATFSEEQGLPYHHNYFIGNDPSQWASEVPLYKKIRWNQIYKGVDAVVYSTGTSLKYDFVVAPGADPDQIVLAYKGVEPKAGKDGSIIVRTSVNEIIEQAPYVYQIINGQTIPVACRYNHLGNGRIGFDFPEGYDKQSSLVIDPVLVFSTFSGSTSTVFGFSATYDLAGNLYAGGESFAAGWPTTLGAFQVNYGGAIDAGINKYSSDGTTLIYSTYYGGSGSDLPNNMMVNANNELFVCGSTNSLNLPTTPGCFDNSFNGNWDIYVARFSNTGSALLAATYLGGSLNDGYNNATLSSNYGDSYRGEVLTADNGSVYVASSSNSTNFPVTTGAAQSMLAGEQDAVICKLNADLSVLEYSTFLGGTNNDAAFSLVLTSNNSIAVCGGTNSANFPTTPGVLHPNHQGDKDGFASIIDSLGNLIHSTYLGTAVLDHAYKIQRDNLDNIFVMGQTAGTSGYPISPGVYNTANGNIFIDKLSPTLSASLLSTRLGNPNGAALSFVPTAFLYDDCGHTYLSGFSAASNSPLTPGAYQTSPGSFWLGALSPGFTTLMYATFFGPTGTHVDGGTSRFDPAGIIYHSACTADPNFPSTPTAYAPVKLSPGYDISSYKFNMEVGALSAAFSLANNANDTGCADYTVSFINGSSGATDYYWNFGDGSSSTAFEPSHTFGEGLHTITLISTRATGCNLADTAEMQLYVEALEKPLLQLSDTFLCDPVPVTLRADVSNINSFMGFQWEPSNAILSGAGTDEVVVDPGVASNITVYISNAAIGACVDTAMGTVHINLFDYSVMSAHPADTSICPGDTITLQATGGTVYTWAPAETLEEPNKAKTRAWPGEAKEYTVRIQNDSGCVTEREVHIAIKPMPLVDAGKDKIIRYGTSVILEGFAPGDFYWGPAGAVAQPNILRPEVAPLTTTTYYLHTHTGEGCVNMDSVTVYVTEAMLPNAFSPNGDGLNDVFRPVIMNQWVELGDFSIYNRYGQRVYYSRDIQEGWDGTYNGQPAELATYFYIITFKIGDKSYTHKGDVTLTR